MPLAFRGLMKSGYDAVSFFFMLSGFVLAYNYYAPTSAAVRGGAPAFWKNRFARIYPIYLVAIIVALPQYLWGVKVGTVQSRDAHVALVAVPLLLQAWFFSSSISGAINLPAWSLSVEAFFYATFPVLLWIISIGPTLTTALAYVGLICSESSLSETGGYFPPYHLFTFIMGLGCGVWFRRASPSPMRVPLYCVTISLCGVLAFRDFIPTYFLSRAVLVPLFGVLIITTASCAGALKLLEHRFLVLLGEASYSLYILHMPLYGLYVAALKRASLNVGTSLGLTTCYLISIVAISVLSHEWIEIPARLRLLRITAKSQVQMSGIRA